MSRKESTCPLASDLVSRRGTDAVPLAISDYPFAVVLRLRVLQIVCGISSMVMGAVAFIEERGEINLAVGLPAGALTLVAAALGIHTSRGFGGYQPSSTNPNSALRCVGSSARIAVPLGLVWGVAVAVQVFLVVQCARALVPGISGTIAVLAGVEATLATVTLAGVLMVLYIDCKYDPD